MKLSFGKITGWFIAAIVIILSIVYALDGNVKGTAIIMGIAYVIACAWYFLFGKKDPKKKAETRSRDVGTSVDDEDDIIVDMALAAQVHSSTWDDDFDDGDDVVDEIVEDVAGYAIATEMSEGEPERDQAEEAKIEELANEAARQIDMDKAEEKAAEKSWNGHADRQGGSFDREEFDSNDGWGRSSSSHDSSSSSSYDSGSSYSSSDSGYSSSDSGGGSFD